MTFQQIWQSHLDCFSALASQGPAIEAIGLDLGGAVSRQNKILVCGNGGSAADAQHFAAELIGRFEKERAAWPAVALTTDTSILTAIGNDYGFEHVFARQVQGLGRRGDILLGISTSGHSQNVLQAVRAARSKEMTSIGLLGRDGGPLKTEVDQAIVVPVQNTARIQEAHSFILHFWAMLMEEQLASAAK
ncbi:MAG: SIS domain-containing protein [Desulfosarcinaceae bacterium]